MKRIYETVIEDHLNKDNQMIFLGGGRQVGKTTLSQNLLQKNEGKYLNWDFVKDRNIILNELDKFIHTNLSPSIKNPTPLLVLDEIHKYKDWKNHLKGIYDLYKGMIKIIVTGSMRMDIYRKGGDSLMGRYFPYTIFPFSIKELCSSAVNLESNLMIHPPTKIAPDLQEALWKFGGFPDPLVKQDIRFFNRWKKLRMQQLLKEEIRDMFSIQDLALLELLTLTLENIAGNNLNYSSLSKHLRISDNTLRRWIELLENFYFCFRITPWSKNIARSLIKEPKVYLWDWSSITSAGAKFENLLATHLLKAVTFWNETGIGNYSLHYIRTKDKKEVDFLVTKENSPWFLVEAKFSKNAPISESLRYFHKELNTEHAFQVVWEDDFVERSCFDFNIPISVPASTFLSQLI